jgi:site-specific DNA-methyltransferase (adenine-specific)
VTAAPVCAGPPPYYADAHVTLWLGDCRELTAWTTAAVLVTDPPYGRAWRQGGLHGARRPGGKPRQVSDAEWGIEGDGDTAVRDAALEMWGRDRPAIVFADLMLGPPPGAKLPLVYAKPPDAGARGAVGGFRRDIEGAYLVGKWPGAPIGGRSALLKTGARLVGSPAGTAGRYGHPHAKPLDVCEILISACPPGAVADPFAGSGSILIAARRAGRDAIGVEVDERYAERCARRLAQADLW